MAVFDKTEFDYEKNGFGEKRGRVRLSRLSVRRMGERCGARVGKAEIGRGFQKEREGAEVETTRVGREFGKQRKDRDTSGRVLRCLTVNLRVCWNRRVTSREGRAGEFEEVAKQCHECDE